MQSQNGDVNLKTILDRFSQESGLIHNPSENVSSSLPPLQGLIDNYLQLLRVCNPTLDNGNSTEDIYKTASINDDEENEAEDYSITSEPDTKRQCMSLVDCPHCSKSFHSDKIIAHICSHTGDKPFKCDECDKSFSRKDKLVVHRRIHTGERPYICFCGREFTRQDKCKSHIATHAKLDILQNQDKIIAPRHECMISNVFKKKLLEMNDTVPVSKPKMICPQCGEKFDSEMLFECHLKTHAGPKSLKDNFKCPCGREFRSLKWLSNHQMRESCPEAEEELKLKTEKNKLNPSNDESSSSSSSSVPSKNVPPIKQPKKRDTNVYKKSSSISPIPLSVESLNVATMYNYLDKLTKKSSEITENRNRDKSSPMALLRNLSSVEDVNSDASKSSLQCTECFKFFPTKSKLVIHMRTHTGEKPFDCSFCGKAFSRKDHLLKHMKTHKKFQDKSEAEKPLQQDIEDELQADIDGPVLKVPSLPSLNNSQSVLNFPSNNYSADSFINPKPFDLLSFINSLQNKKRKECNETSEADHQNASAGTVASSLIVKSCSSSMGEPSRGMIDDKSKVDKQEALGVDEYINLLTDSSSENKQLNFSSLNCPVCQQSVLSSEFKSHLFTHSKGNERECSNSFSDIL